MKYVAIKIKGFDHYIWFQKSKTIRENGNFIGIEGWGKRGAFTEITIAESEIIGEIKSAELQYDNN